MSFTIGKQQIETDADGFLCNLEDWNEPVAELLAAAEGLELSVDHWEILRLARQFYSEFQLSPAMRPLVKYTAKRLGAEKGRSIYLLTLFPGRPAKLIAKIAGLPKPENCL